MGRAKERKREADHGPQWLAAMMDVFRGGLIAVLSALAVLAGCSFLISCGLVADSRMSSAVIAACLVGALIGGLFAIMRRKNQPLAFGLLVGGVLFLMLLSAGFLIYGRETAAQSVGSVLCACMCGGGLAGILGSKPKKKRRR